MVKRLKMSLGMVPKVMEKVVKCGKSWIFVF
jgi:hypothetical protein